MGQRAWLKVVERDGQRGVVVARTVLNPLHELWRAAWDDAGPVMAD